MMLDTSADSLNQKEQDLDSDLADELEELEGPVQSQHSGSFSTSIPGDSTSSSQDPASTPGDVDSGDVPSVPPTQPQPA